MFRQILNVAGVTEVRYNELSDEIIVFRSEEELVYWSDLKAQVIAILIEFLPHKSHPIDDNELADHWTAEDKLIDNVITVGLKPVMKKSSSGKIQSTFFIFAAKTLPLIPENKAAKI